MILIHAQEFPDWEYIEGPLTLRISRDDIFVTESGVPYVGGEKKSERGWFIEIPCTIGEATIPNSSSIKSLFVPEFYLAETVTSDAPFTNYVAELFDAEGKIRKFFIKKFRLPLTENNEITWKEIRTFAQSQPIDPQPEYLTAAEQYAIFLRRSQLLEIVGNLVIEELEITTDKIIEGENNLYFTTERVLAIVEEKFANLSTNTEFLTLLNNFIENYLEENPSAVVNNEFITNLTENADFLSFIENYLEENPSAVVNNEFITNLTENADFLSFIENYVNEHGGGDGGGTSLSEVQILHTTASIANNANIYELVELGKSFILSKISADKPCRVRIYRNSACQVNDLARNTATTPAAFNENTPFEGRHGVTADVLLNLEFGLVADSPNPPIGVSAASPRSSNIHITVTNLSGSAAAINLTFFVTKLEA